MLSVIKQYFKFIKFKIVNLFVVPSNITNKKTILIIRREVIGDYILFRNFLDILKQSKKYEGYTITLIGNIVWKEIAEKLDDETIDNFIWINQKEFNNNLSYRYQKLKEITINGYEVVINTSYSRDFFLSDWIVGFVNADEKIGSYGDLSNIKQWQKDISDKYYTRLIPSNKKVMFEFDRNREFFEQLLDEKITIKKPHIDSIITDIRLSHNYIVLFLGASQSFRKWSIKNFVAIAEYIDKKYNYEIILVGGPAEYDDAKEFENLSHITVKNLVGKTTLLDVIYILDKAKLLISNETSAPHFAVALDTETIVLSNGNHFGRFTPYPKTITDRYHVVFSPQIESLLDEPKNLIELYGDGSPLDINEISVTRVIEEIDQILLVDDDEK